MTEQPIKPRGLQPKDLKNTLGRRPRASTPPPGGADAAASAARAEPASAGDPARREPADGAEQGTALQTPTVLEQGSASGPGASRSRRRPHTVFYLPVDLSTDLREFARRRNKTNADVIFDALESTLEELPQLLKPGSEGEGADSGRAMFTRTPTRTVGQKVQISGRIQDDNLAIIDGLVDQHSADSRSHLVEVALRAYLSTHTPVPAH